MVEWLSEQGHQVDVVTAPPYYPEWQVHKGYKRWRFSREKLKHGSLIRCPLYVPSNPSTLKRLIHLVSFSVSSALALFTKLFDKPDVVFVVQPTLFCAPVALLYARLTGAKVVMHIQDYEIDAMFGLGMMKRGLLTRVVKKVERWLMRQFDAITTISLSMMNNAKEKGVDESKNHLFPNWADVDFVTPEISGEQLKAEWGFSAADKVVLYAGNIGKKQGLESVLNVAEKFLSISGLYFVLVGTGAQVDVLRDDAVARGLSNVYFKPLQPWSRVPEMLAVADIHLVIQKKGTAGVVLPSKLTNILSAGGHAIVAAEKETELGLLAEKCPDIYTLIEPEDAGLLFDALSCLLEKKLDSPNRVAREYAVAYLSQDKILEQFETDMNALCEH
jgi:colanic acid biosynthesis glycosyl transferase WcaI